MTDACVSIDIRLKAKEISILRSVIGKELSAIRHDPLFFVNSSLEVVQIDAENGSFYLYSHTEPLDYFGTLEDVAVWSLENKRYEFVDQKNLVKTAFKAKIKNVRVVQENQRLFKKGVWIYDVWLTRGIVFDFGKSQLSFEKAVWFSEEIYIQTGCGLVDKFSDVGAFADSDWNEGFTAECFRETTVLGE